MDFIEIHRPSQYLVFGCSLTALTAIQGLHEMGVPLNTVFWGHPEAEDSTSWSHGDKAVADRALTALSKLGVRMMPYAELLEVQYEEGRITHVILRRYAFAFCFSCLHPANYPTDRALAYVSLATNQMISLRSRPPMCSHGSASV
jgi:hypothetical protein